MKTDLENLDETKKEKKIRKLSKEDENEFNEIYNKYYKKVFYTIWKIVYDKYDTEELVQEVFAYYFERPDLYDKRRSLEAYLVFVAKRRAITFKKKLDRRDEIVNENKEYMVKDNSFESIGKSLERDDEVKFVREEINRLKPEYRDVIKLICFEGKSYKDAAKILNKSETNIKVTLHRAKAKLKSNIEQRGFKDYFLNFIVIALVILGLSCTYNAAKNKLFKNPKSYTYNDNSIEVSIETLERYKNILEALKINIDSSLKVKYIPTNKDKQDVLEISNDEFSLAIFEDEIMDFVVNFDSANINVLDEINENTIKDLDKKLYNDEIIETSVKANEEYSMINVKISDEEYRVYIVSNDNKIMKIRNMKQYYIENSIDIDKDDVERIVKAEYGEDIEIKNIELTQTKLNTVVTENNIGIYYEDDDTNNYGNLNFANKDFNFYLVWQVTFSRNLDGIDKTFWIYIDTYTGKIVKNSIYMESN